MFIINFHTTTKRQTHARAYHLLLPLFDSIHSFLPNQTPSNLRSKKNIFLSVSVSLLPFGSPLASNPHESEKPIPARGEERERGREGPRGRLQGPCIASGSGAVDWAAGMDHGGGEGRVVAERRTLRAGVDKSRALGHALARAGPRLEEIQAALPALEAAVRPIRAPRAELAAAGPHIDRAVGPAAAVLKVFDAVHGLEPPQTPALPGTCPATSPSWPSSRRRIGSSPTTAGSPRSGSPTLSSTSATATLPTSGSRSTSSRHFPAGDIDDGLLAAAMGIIEAEFHRTVSHLKFFYFVSKYKTLNKINDLVFI